jgi:predicted methyltransferase
VGKVMGKQWAGAAAGVIVAAAGALAAWQGAAAVFPSIPRFIVKAVADPGRPKADTDRDDERKPADMLVFAQVKPGQRVVDFMPGGGYFTRLFSVAVGPKGRVYAFFPAELAKFTRAGPLPANGSQPDKDHPNVFALVAPADIFATPEPVDMVWTSQNYHDLHDPFMGPVDMKAFDTAVFNSLKPGGIFVVLDHAAPDGSGTSDTNTLHRIDEAAVKSEVTSVGFVLDAESDVLRNPADPRTALVFDKSIRGHTDQFILRFRKPK